jgi:CspA family cold shock protein
MLGTSERLTGTVKWFNNKAGFGFITVCGDGGYGGKDIFVHYSSIRVSNSQYKYLIQGEYVDFTLVTAKNDKHEFHAMDISGVKGGPIMCETRSSEHRQHNSFGQGQGQNNSSGHRQNSSEQGQGQNNSSGHRQNSSGHRQNSSEQGQNNSSGHRQNSSERPYTIVSRQRNDKGNKQITSNI